MMRKSRKGRSVDNELMPGLGDSSFPPSVVVKGKTYALATRPDGRACQACGALDTSKDPLTGVTIRWYYPPSAAGTNVTSVCWYCGRVHHSYWRPRFATLPIFIAALGATDGDHVQVEHRKLRAILVQAVIDQGTYEVRRIFAENTTVESIDRKRTTVQGKDLHIELEYYKHHYEGGKGDPYCNGLGHTVCYLDGVLGVKISGPPVREIITAHDAMVGTRKIEDDGSLQLTEDHMKKMADSIAAGMGLLGSSSSSSGVRRASAGPSPGKVKVEPDVASLGVKREIVDTPSPVAKAEPPSTSPAGAFGFQIVVPQIPGAPDTTSQSVHGGVATAGGRGSTCECFRHPLTHPLFLVGQGM